MSKTVCSFLKGMGAGLAVGAATGIAICSMTDTNHKTAKKKISHAVKSVSDFMENLSYMLK